MRYDKDWYNNLEKPPFQPPAWVFSPVWIILYAFIGVSFLLVLYSPVKTYLFLDCVLFAIQLILNLSWTPVFFKLHKIMEAFFICLALTIVVFFMLIVFFQTSVLAGIFLIPYFLWLVFACILNFSVWLLNKNI